MATEPATPLAAWPYPLVRPVISLRLPLEQATHIWGAQSFSVDSGGDQGPFRQWTRSASTGEASAMNVRAEHDSLATWLENALTPEQRRHIGLVSLNQWPVFTAMMAEIALTAHSMGSTVTVGMWADETPLPDPGWTTSRSIARLMGSKSLDENVVTALIQLGFSPKDIASPPIKKWRPRNLPKLPRPVTRADIRQLTYRGSAMGRAILQVHPNTNTPIRENHPWPRRYTQRAITSYAWVYDQVKALIHERDISTIVVYNGRFTHDQAAAAAAKAAGIQVLYYDGGGLETGFDLTFAPIHDWDELQSRMIHMWESWHDPERTHVGEEWFRNRQTHREPGLDVFVGLQERGNIRGLPQGKRIIAFFSSSPDEIAELDLNWSKHFGSQTKALACLANAVRSRPDMELVVRTHPHMRLKPTGDWVDWKIAVANANPAAHFDADDSLDSYALMRAADVVFTYGSTSGIEAAFIGTPVAVMGPSAYNLLGCVTQITSEAELESFLDEPGEVPRERALSYGLMMQRRGFNFTHIQTDLGGDYRLDGIVLRDAKPSVLKISDALRGAKMRWLTYR